MRHYLPDNNGHTLVELLIGISILGILAVVIFPTYQDSVRKGHRSNAKGELLRLADEQEKWRMTHTRYGTLPDLGGNIANDYYVFTISDNTHSGFIISAAPTSKNNQNADACGTLQITQEHNLTGSNATACPQP